jgi:hypothetical protein
VKLVFFTPVIEAIILISIVFLYFLDDQWMYAWFYGKTLWLFFAACYKIVQSDSHFFVIESAKTGVYKITIAFRSFDLDMKMMDASRDDVEKSWTFGGFINWP